MAWHPTQDLVYNPYIRLKWYGFSKPIFTDMKTGDSYVQHGFQNFQKIEKPPVPELGIPQFNNNIWEGSTLIFTKKGRKKYNEIKKNKKAISK